MAAADDGNLVRGEGGRVAPHPQRGRRGIDVGEQRRIARVHQRQQAHPGLRRPASVFVHPGRVRRGEPADRRWRQAQGAQGGRGTAGQGGDRSLGRGGAQVARMQAGRAGQHEPLALGKVRAWGHCRAA
jgi:hypothetical protein